MKGIFYECVGRIFAARKKHRRFINIMLILSVLAAVDVFWTLHRIGIAMTDEFLCGKAEHVHSAECLSDTNGCGLEEHTHTAECTSDISADVETEEVWLSTLPSDLSDNWRDNMAAIALSQVGYRESERNFTVGDGGERNGYTRYGQWYGNPYGNWNTMFVYFCMFYAGIDTDNIPYGSGCQVWAENLAESGMLMRAENGTPAAGDVFFLDTDLDGQADRTAVVTETESTVSGLNIQAAEGDINGEIVLTSYLWGDEHIVGFLSLEQPDISDPGNNIEYPYSMYDNNENISYGEYPEILPEEDEEISAVLPDYPVYLANLPYIFINGVQDTSYSGDRKPIKSGETFVYEVRLDKKTDDGNYNHNAFFEEIDKTRYNTGIINCSPEMQYQYFESSGRYFYSNAYTDSHGKIPLTREIVFYPSTETAVFRLEGKFDPPAVGQESYDVNIRFNSCESGAAKPVTCITVKAPEILMLSPVYSYNKSQERADAYVAMAGDTFIFKAKVGFEESGSVIVADNYELTDEEKAENQGLRIIKLKNDPSNRTIKTYARFQSFGDVNTSEAWSDPRVTKPDNADYELSEDGTTLTLTYKIDIKHAVVDYRYYIVEFQMKKGYNFSERFWLDIPPAESTSTLEMVKIDKTDCNPAVDHSVHGANNPFQMKTWSTITLKGTTKYFDQKTESEYNQLTSDERRKYIKVAGDNNSVYYLKTNARFWAYDEDKDAEGHLKDTLLKRGTTKYNVIKDSNNVPVTLEIYAEYSAKESNIDALANITFFDGTPTNIEWSFYKVFFVKVLKRTEEGHYVYIKTATQGWRDINMITEFNEDIAYILPPSNEFGYINNCERNPYIVYVENEDDKTYPDDYYKSNDMNKIKIELYVPKKSKTDDGDFTVMNNQIGSTGEDALKGSRNVLQQKTDTMIYRCYYINSYYINNVYKKDYTVHILFKSGGEEIDIYIRLFPRNAKDGTLEFNYDVFNHCDIEISDDGIYTLEKKVELPKNDPREYKKWRVTQDIYASAISRVISCDIYDERGNPVKCCSYNGNETYSDDAKFIEKNYISSGTPGSTQFEFTSAYKSVDPFVNQDIYFLRKDVYKVEFVVQITLTPYKRIISYKDAEDNQVGDIEQETFTGNPIAVKNIKLTMDKDDIEAAINKCPTHTGLDFTYNGNLKDTENGIGEIEPAKPFVKVYKKLENGNIMKDQFSFLITDLTTGDQYEVKNRRLGESNDEEEALGLSIVQLSPEREYYAEGTYRFLIQEIIPPDYEKSDIIYSEAAYIMEIKVSYKERPENVTVNGNTVTKLKRYFYYESSYYSANGIQLETYGEHDAPVFLNTRFRYTLPSTGGIGTCIFYTVGGVLIIVPLVMLICRKRKER